jgi:hypothetical protein
MRCLPSPAPHPIASRRAAATSGTFLAVALVACGASQEPNHEPFAADWDGVGWMATTTSDALPDAGPVVNEAQPCDDEGARIECGRVTERHANYVTCSMGYRTCSDGVWGACIGERSMQPTTDTSSAP